MASARLDVRHFSFSQYTTGAFQAATLVLELRGSEWVCGFFKWNCLGLQKFLPQTQLLLVFATRSCEDLSSWLWTLGWVSSCGAGTPCSLDILPKFLSTCWCGTSPFHVCTPPTSLDGCGFFNSLVVRHPFNSIADDSEWWWVYTSVVILMWLCEEVSMSAYTILTGRLPFYCIFFHYLLSPLYSPSPCNYYTVVHVHESFFLFAQSLYPLTCLPRVVSLLSMYLSVFC